MPNPHARGPPLVGCPRLLVQYIRSYPPYLEAVSSIRNLGTRHAIFFAKYNWNDQVKEDDMGGVCSTCGTGQQLTQVFGGKARRNEITRKTYKEVGG
jgi:hypothetical protein